MNEKPMTASKLLEELTQAYARRDLLEIRKKESLPADVVKIIKDNDLAFKDRIEDTEKMIAGLELEVRAAVLSEGATAKGGSMMATWNKPRVTWDSAKLDGMMILVPALKEARKEGQPTVTIKKVATGQ